MKLDDINKNNWKEFRAKVPHTDIKKENRKRFILVDEHLWRDFSVCVIKRESKSNQNSKVIVELICQYIKDTTADECKHLNIKLTLPCNVSLGW